MIRARYAFGKIVFEALDSDWVKDGTLPPETNAQTIAYCKRHSGHRFRSLQEADEYVRRASDGEIVSLERE